MSYERQRQRVQKLCCRSRESRGLANVSCSEDSNIPMEGTSSDIFCLDNSNLVGRSLILLMPFQLHEILFPKEYLIPFFYTVWCSHFAPDIHFIDFFPQKNEGTLVLPGLPSFFVHSVFFNTGGEGSPPRRPRCAPPFCASSAGPRLRGWPASRPPVERDATSCRPRASASRCA